MIFLTGQLIGVFPRKNKRKNRRAPWISDDIVKIARKKKLFYKKAKSSDNADLWSKYKNINNMLKKKCTVVGIPEGFRKQFCMTKKNINSFGTMSI